MATFSYSGREARRRRQPRSNRQPHRSSCYPRKSSSRPFIEELIHDEPLTDAYEPTVNQGEQIMENLLKYHNITFEKEPHTFELTHKIKGSYAFKPDYWLPEYTIYFEVTQGGEEKRRDKQRKIEDVMSNPNHDGIEIVLVGPDQLDRLANGMLSIWELMGIDNFKTSSEEEAA